MESNLKEHLKGLPEYCRLIPLGKREINKETGKWWTNPKAGKETGWRHNNYNLDQVCQIKKTGIGLIQGLEGGGLVCIDPDGDGAEDSFEYKIGRSIKDLPKTVTWTSGTPNRYQLVLRVPDHWWGLLKPKDLEKDNCATCQILWSGQSVIAGLHSSGRYYQWLEGCSPAEVDIAEAPEWFLTAWAELCTPKVIISDRAKETTGKSIDQLTEEQLKHHNLARAKKGLKEWFTDAKYYPEPKWRDIGICLKQLGNDDWGDPDKFFDLWHDWSERDPRPGKYDGYQACAEKWEEIKVVGPGERGIRFASFIFWALQDGFLTKEDLTQEEKVAVEKLSKKDPARDIGELMNKLYALEKLKGSWDQKQALRSSLWGHHIKKEVIEKRLLELFAQEYGLNIGESEKRKYRTLASPIAEKDKLRPQLPGFTLGGRDHVLVGQAGTGKTTLALAISYAVFTGAESLLDRTDGVPIEEQGATVYIGSDGGEGALGMIQEYIKQLKLPNDAAWRANTTFIGANSETGETSWGLTIRNLTELVELLKQGNPNGAPYRLLVLDTLKTILDEADIDFGVGPMGTVMALIQAIASRYNCAVLWLHHNAKGASTKDKGIDAAGGNGNIVQKANAVISLQKVKHSQYPDVVRCEVQKLRGEPVRDFDFTFDTDNGGFKVIPREELEERTDQILYQIWMRQDSGASTTEIWKGVKDGVEKTVRNQLTALRKQKLIKSKKSKWFLEVAGMKRLAVEAAWAKEEIDEYLKGEGKTK